MKPIIRDVIVSEKELKPFMKDKKEMWLFNLAATKVMPEIEDPDLPIRDDYSVYVTLHRDLITLIKGTTVYPFSITIKDDKKSLLRFNNIKKQKTESRDVGISKNDIIRMAKENIQLLNDNIELYNRVEELELELKVAEICKKSKKYSKK